MKPYYEDSSITLHHGDCLDVLRAMPDASMDSVVTDPPYGLEFMGKGWDAPWRESDVNADAGFHGGGVSATKNAPSFTGSTNPKCLRCKGTRRGRRDGTAKVAVCLCDDGGRFPNVRAVEMRAFAEWCETWVIECLRVLKPGGHLLAFGGTRTWHRLACAVEDAGFEVRDSIAWLYGSGFPKSLDVGKSIDRAAGVQRGANPDLRNGPNTDSGTKGDKYSSGYTQTAPLDGGPVTPDAARWQGWGTALKPAFEPIVVARKSLAGTVAANVLAHGTGALNIDGCRIEAADSQLAEKYASVQNAGPRANSVYGTDARDRAGSAPHAAGRWPANVILDESQAEALDEQSGASQSRIGKPRGADSGEGWGMTATGAEYDDQGGASRFMYVAKADASERVKVDGIAHPTVKPLDIMRWLVRLVTPPGGTVLEPFAGSGTTVEACILEGFHCVAIEREADYLPLIVQRINRRRDPVAAVKGAGGDGGLFDLLDTTA